MVSAADPLGHNLGFLYQIIRVQIRKLKTKSGQPVPCKQL
jgi:hypothetical protein